MVRACAQLPAIFKEKDIMVRSMMPSLRMCSNRRDVRLGSPCNGAILTRNGWLLVPQTMFGQFDVNGSGSISAAQCKSGACTTSMATAP